MRKVYSDERLLREYHRVARKAGREPTWRDVDRHAMCSSRTIIDRFGGRLGVTDAYRRWLSARSLSAAPARPGRARCRMRSLTFGTPLDFRGLRHAPTNEAGVVFLFGALAADLGFVIDGFSKHYPDCEARRRLDEAGTRWARVRIEFEYRARNFELHGHDPAGCDLIVCWVDDWARAPVEVLELKGAVEMLEEKRDSETAKQRDRGTGELATWPQGHRAT